MRNKVELKEYYYFSRAELMQYVQLGYYSHYHPTSQSNENIEIIWNFCISSFSTLP